MAEIKFYTHPRSRGRMIRWMLEEVGADYDPVYLEYGAMNGEEYRHINPMAKVPAIVHGANIVTECAAICAYLADTFPDAGLAPPPNARALYYRWMFFASGPLESAIINQALGVELEAEQKGFVGYGDMGRVLDTLETAVGKHKFITGDEFSAADVYLGAQLSFGLQFGTVEKRKTFEDYVQRATDREAFRRAAALDDAVLADG
ncbi:MAG TPA: glutathione S-transferase family protein [Wenzhouxiangellaceae bacterium]|nr:glutathione S-transferase family protein [Wenzhouxiangellaceae bacterium]HKL52436.1 glutathione S-transferase family protein [Wenzhouxiangellaceae bacterium]